MSIDKEVFSKLKERMKAKFPILLEGYLKDAKAYMVMIETSLPDANIKDLIEASHSLKSASGLLGVIHVSELAEKLEYAGKEKLEQGATSIESLRITYNELQNAFAAVEGDLRNELSKAKSC